MNQRATKAGIGIIAMPLVGLFVIAAGFVYDLIFAGIPYQDPTPEMLAGWNFHRSVAEVFFKAGGMLLAAGLIAIPIIRRRTAGQNRHTAEKPRP